jgi:glycerol uptake facilitator-like aquaporin
MKSGPAILLLNLALAFYNVGTIWAHEIDIFPSWKLVNADNFRVVHTFHWRTLPYWIFAPVGVALFGGIALVWVHPADSPLWAIYGALICQILASALTAAFWGRWQAQLATDPLGPQSPYLGKILRTHWIRTLLINAYAGFLLVASIVAFD